MDKKATMKWITVLDFEIGRVFRYNIQGQVLLTENKDTWCPDSESCEEFISSVGHNLGNCEWMVHSDRKVYTRFTD